MARARNIKPAFFKNEQLVELPYATRLLFIGLWTLADREGRLEDRPKKIKMEVFPADNIDVDKALDELDQARFIHRYAVGRSRFIAVCAFKKHQNPHHREGKSVLPEPGASLGLDTDGIGQEPEAECSCDPPQAPALSEAGPIPAVLIPDSGFLIPDSTPLAESADAPPAGDAVKPTKKKPVHKPFTTGPVIILIPLVGKDEYEVHQALVDELEKLYPAVDVPQTLREIRGWNLARPSQRKTAAGILRHINTWLSKEQNKG